MVYKVYVCICICIKSILRYYTCICCTRYAYMSKIPTILPTYKLYLYIRLFSAFGLCVCTSVWCPEREPGKGNQLYGYHPFTFHPHLSHNTHTDTYIAISILYTITATAVLNRKSIHSYIALLGDESRGKRYKLIQYILFIVSLF